LALDRQSIEKKDFPIGRRGYEPEAVDAHLEALAAEVDQLKRSKAGAPAGAGAASLALAASEQVRTIVEAAESSAAAIEAAAQDEAARIRREAEIDARGTRDDAVAKSEEHVGKVAESTQLMLQRVDAMESELGALIESLRTGANRLNADLTLLQGNMGELYGAAGSTAAAAPEPVVEIVPEPEPVAAPEPEPVAFAEPEPVVAAEPEPGLFESTEPAPVPVEDVPAAPAPDPVPAPAAAAPAADGDVEGARLIALNMALNGSSREETDRYLGENFDLADRQGLLDEVYATIG
jgi:DivIVA domain-containing protein